MDKLNSVKLGTIVIGIYYHPEAYPPTLNAIQELSKVYQRVVVVYRPHLEGNWEYPQNVIKVPSGKGISSRDQENSSLTRKILFFFLFIWDFYNQCRKYKPSIILCYDSFALLSFRLFSILITFKHKLWYHNHDIAEIEKVRKYSIGWFAVKQEKKIFSKINLFTLPAESRKKYFPIEEMQADCIVVPNYPSRHLYNTYYSKRCLGDKIKLIFQGRIGEGHGLEEIISLIPNKIEGKQIELILKGYCDKGYQDSLMLIAKKYNVESSITFLGFGPYKEVPAIASKCHIGIGLFSANEIMHLTLGTSSNKLYEYSALGLPVIYSNRKYFTEYLGEYEWAVAVNDDAESIRNGIVKIIQQYETLSESARNSFISKLNFEQVFKPVNNWIENNRITVI